MQLQIVEECQNSYLGCIRSIISALISIFLLSLTCYCLKLMYQYLEYNLRIEIIPLVNIGIQNILWIGFVLVLSNLKIEVSTHLFQISTIGVVTLGFMKLFFVIKKGEIQLSEKASKLLFIVPNIIVLIILVLICFDVLKLQCDIYFKSNGFLIIDSIQLILIVICVFFGVKLITVITLIKNSHKTLKQQGFHSKFSNIITEIMPDEDFYIQIMKQTKIVIISILVYALLYVLLQAIKYGLNVYSCSSNDNIISITTVGQYIMLAHMFIELLPSMVLVIIFYFMPLKQQKGQPFTFNQEEGNIGNLTIFENKGFMQCIKCIKNQQLFDTYEQAKDISDILLITSKNGKETNIGTHDIEQSLVPENEKL